MEIKPEGSQNLLQMLLNWGYWVLRLIDLRLAIVIGSSVFLLAVGLDSSANYATAADLRQASIQATPAAFNQAQVLKRVPKQVQPEPDLEDEASYLEFDPAIANRLKHGDLTSASLTSSRLTRAHFFTDSINVSPH
ncbi:MAG: hypothetical protein ICV77_03160 [Cyanobacteria bacterium Co-bin8]|nr:hypothetical protein [Cyanobacteria bacterium Co-bin8]